MGLDQIGMTTGGRWKTDRNFYCLLNICVSNLHKENYQNIHKNLVQVRKFLDVHAVNITILIFAILFPIG